MRARFAESPTSFDKHELLELVLFYAVPRTNVNPVAHRLTNKFKDISAILHARPNELRAIKGVGDNTAIFLNALGRLCDECAEETLLTDRIYDYSAAKAYFLRIYRFYRHEVFTLLLLDANRRVITKKEFSNDNPDSVDLPFEPFLKTINTNTVKSIVVAHNHPGETPQPSPNDIQSTISMKVLCRVIGVQLADHVIVGENSTYSFFHDGNLSSEEADKV